MATTAFKLLLLCSTFGLSGCQSSPEWFQNISTNLFNLPGDIMLGGLFHVRQATDSTGPRVEPEDIPCDSLDTYGLGRALVMKYAVDEINADQLLLPGIKLGYEILDTCKQTANILKPTLFFLTEKSTEKLAVTCNYTDFETRVVAVIGPSSSELVSVVGKLLGFFLMPMISYGATSEQFSNKKLYASFLRTVPSDKGLATAMVHLLKEFEWNWVAVVGSEGAYGRQGQQMFSRIAGDMSICVAYEGIIPVYDDDVVTGVNTMLDKIQATSVGVVVLFSTSIPTKIFFKEVIKRNMTGVWIASSAWALDHRVYDIPNIHKVGTIIGFTDNTQPPRLFTNYTLELFTKISEEKKTTGPAPVPGMTPQFRDPCPQCWSLSSANISLVKKASVQRTAFSVYAAVYSVAKALRTILGCNTTVCVWGAHSEIRPWQLLEAFKKTALDTNGTLDMMKGTNLVFDKSGNPDLGYNMVEWVWKNGTVDFIDVGTFYKKLSVNMSLLNWHTPNSEVPQSSCSAKCKPGQVRRVKGFHSCCFDCIDCMAGTYQAKSEDIDCTACPKDQWSQIKSNKCTKPTFDVLSWDRLESVALMVAGAVLLVCQGSVGVLFLKNRGTPLVSASGGVLSGVTLLGLMGGCLSLLLFLGQPGDLVCRLQLPLASIFHTAALSVILAVSLQIFYVTEFPQKAASHLDTIRGRGSWLLVLVCCGVQAGVCGWYIQTGRSLSEHLAKMDINFLRAFLHCPNDQIALFLMQGLNVCLSLASFMCTFMATKPLHQYNLARDITFSTLIYCVIWVGFIPIYTGLSPRQSAISHIAFSLGSNVGFVAAYYFPKCYLLLKKPELNSSEHFRTFLEGAPPTPQEDTSTPPPPQPSVPEPQPGQNQ